MLKLAQRHSSFHLILDDVSRRQPGQNWPRDILLFFAQLSTSSLAAHTLVLDSIYLFCGRKVNVEE